MEFLYSPKRLEIREPKLPDDLEHRRDRILQALYAAAAAPGEHERFIDEWNAALDADYFQDPGEDGWVESHIEKALSVFERLEFADAKFSSLNEVVNNQSGAAAIVDRDGLITAENDLWVESFGGNGSSLFSLSTRPAEQKKFRAAILSLHTILETRVSYVHFTDAFDHRHTVVLRRLPYQPGGKVNGGDIIVRLAGNTWTETISSFLVNEFGLTPTELETTKHLTEGGTFNDIADWSDGSAETIKSHAKAVYSKIGVSNRVELVRMVVQLQMLVQGATGGTSHSATTKAREFSLELSDGRRLFWDKRGAAAGRRFLFLHGLGLGYQFSSKFESLLTANGLTAICIDRPGYGRSDPPVDWRRSLEEWSTIFPEVQNLLGLEPGPLVTQTGGIVFASVAASRYPNLVTGVCAFAAGVPITSKAQLKKYPRQFQLISRTARYSSTALRFIMVTAASYFTTDKARERMIARTYANSPSDVRALKQTGVHESVCESMDMISKGGFDGFVGDNMFMWSDWSRHPRATKCEIAYLNGTEDRVCPIDWALEFAADQPHIGVSSVEGAGQLLLHSHPEPAIQHLLACFERFDA